MTTSPIQITLWKQEKSIDLRMVLSIQASGEDSREKDLEYKFGQMEQGMKENGRKIKLMEKENFGMLTETSLMENGRKTKHLVMEYIIMQTEQNMKESGKKTYSMDLEQKAGLMDLDTREIIMMAKNKAEVPTSGQMGQGMSEIGTTI